jgi:DNA modification methylase
MLPTETTDPARLRPARPWPAEKIVQWPVERLVPYANNPRLHTAADVARIAASIQTWGWTNPPLVDEEGVLIAGHARIAAAAKLGVKFIPVVVARGWTEDEKQAYRIADNQLTLRGDWDPELLRGELGELQFAGFDLGLTGFDPDQLDSILASLGSGGLTDPDAVPELGERAVTQPGDTWLLDGHRVRCGDSTDPTDVTEALGGAAPHLMVTDPPYGVSYEPSWRKRRGLGSGKHATGKVPNDDRADWREAYALFPGNVAYVWHAAMHGAIVADGLDACGFQPRAQIIWVKHHFALSRGDYHWKHEACWYAVREGKPSQWSGDRKQTTVWEIANNNPFGNTQREESWGHGTQKPVECMRRPIENNTRPGQAIYDPFLGSGTSVIAAEMTGRTCCGLELKPGYVDVVVRRWQAFTGRTARHAITGETFDARTATQDPETDQARS